MNKKIKENYINIGTGRDYTINDYVKKLIKLILNNKNIKIKYDKQKPNGMPRKVVDISLAKEYGWKAKTKLDSAIQKTYLSFLQNEDIKIR